MKDTQRLWIPFSLPGQNEIIKACKGSFGKGRVYSAKKRQISAQIGLAIFASRLRPVPACAVHFTWHERTKRRDPDNITAGQKFVFDALVEAGVIPGDGWAHVKGISHDWATSERPGVWVFIEEREAK